MYLKIKILFCLFSLLFALGTLLCVPSAQKSMAGMHHHMPETAKTVCVSIHGFFLQASQNLNILQAVKIFFALVLLAFISFETSLLLNFSLPVWQNNSLMRQFLSRRKFVSWLALLELHDFRLSW